MSVFVQSYKREVYERCPLPEVDQLYIGILDRERPRLDTHPIFFTDAYYDYDANAWQRG